MLRLIICRINLFYTQISLLGWTKSKSVSTSAVHRAFTDIDTDYLGVALEVFRQNVDETTILCGKVKYPATRDIALCLFEDILHSSILGLMAQ